MQNIQVAAEIVLVTLIFMGLDILTGYIGALRAKTMDSAKMREGLAHKYSLIVLMAVGGLIDFLQGSNILDLGFDVPVLEVTCVYIIFMELTSITENVVIIFPELKNSKLMSVFAHNDSEVSKVVESIEAEQPKIEQTVAKASASTPKTADTPSDDTEQPSGQGTSFPPQITRLDV